MPFRLAQSSVSGNPGMPANHRWNWASRAADAFQALRQFRLQSWDPILPTGDVQGQDAVATGSAKLAGQIQGAIFPPAASLSLIAGQVQDTPQVPAVVPWPVLPLHFPQTAWQQQAVVHQLGLKILAVLKGVLL